MRMQVLCWLFLYGIYFLSMNTKLWIIKPSQFIKQIKMAFDEDTKSKNDMMAEGITGNIQGMPQILHFIYCIFNYRYCIFHINGSQ